MITLSFIPGGYELIVILFVVLLLFGGKKIPELMRGLGKGIREFNGARASIESEIKEGMKTAEKEAKKVEEKAEEEVKTCLCVHRGPEERKETRRSSPMARMMALPKGLHHEGHEGGEGRLPRGIEGLIAFRLTVSLFHTSPQERPFPFLFPSRSSL